jgi:DNA-binding MarR family transcriptional regulator
MVDDGPLHATLTLVRAENELRRRLDSRLSGLHGLSLNDLVVLRELQRAPDSRLRRVDLADALGITSSAVTRLLLSLEKIGLVGREPNPTDARSAHAILTTAGHRLATDAGRTASQVAGDLLGGRLSALETATLARLLAKLTPARRP